MSRYARIGSSIKGGIGKVVPCHDPNLDRKVAVKLVQSGGDHARLLDELMALQQVRSKHVVELFDVTYLSPRNQMGIVEEFVDGKDLKLLLGKVTPDSQFLRLLFQMATGVADIHAVNVVHRDLKPSNMLIDGDGILKIIDFNLSRAIDQAHTKGFRGTRGYAAPELYVDDDVDVDFDPKVDVYALGVTAFALLAGTPLPSQLWSLPPDPDDWKAATGGFRGLSLSLDAELVRLLDASVSEDPVDRPAATDLRDRAERVLLHGKHRALFTYEAGTVFELTSGQKVVTLKHSSGNSAVTIRYDDLDFHATAVTGDVWANNVQLAAGATLPGSYVIALGGAPGQPRDRQFITMDVSHPEFVL